MKPLRPLLTAFVLAALPAFGDPAPAPAAAAGASPAATTPTSGAKPAPAKAAPAAKKAPVSAAAAAVAAAAAADNAPVNPRFKQIHDRISYLFHTDVVLTPVTSSRSNPFRLPPPPGDPNAKKAGAPGAKGQAGDGGPADAADAADDSGGDDGSMPGGAGGHGKRKHVRGKEVDPDDPDAYGDDDSDAKIKKLAEDLDNEIPSKPGARITGTAGGPAAKTLKHAIVSLKIEGISVLNGVPRISIGGLLHREGDFVRQPGRGRPVWLQILKITPTSVMFGLRDGGDTGPHFTVQM